MSQYYKHKNGLDWVVSTGGKLWWVGQRNGFWSYADHDNNHQPMLDNRPLYRTRADAIKALEGGE
jgi:hypothetical protein